MSNEHNGRIYPVSCLEEAIKFSVKAGFLRGGTRELKGVWTHTLNTDIKPLHGGGISRFYLLAPKRQRREQRQNKKKGSKNASN